MPKKNKPSMTLTLTEFPELPEDIQRRIILSFPPKAFTRSSILSKSWLSFYNSTRCSFDFSLLYNNDSRRVPEELSQEIMNFDKFFSASLLREKLTVDEFNINIDLSRDYFYCDDELADLVYKWLAALLTTNSIVKVLRIKILSPGAISKLYMPPEIFSNESLQVLHLEYDSILDRVHQSLQVPAHLGCLRFLSLYDILIDDKSTNHPLTVCPILEQLTLSTELGGQHIIIKGLPKLKDLNIRGFKDVRIQEAPALENVSIVQYEIDDRTIINSRVCRRIKLLDMSVYSERTATYIQKIVSCLPALENIRISSRCLENLTLYISEFQRDLKMVKINAPNLRCYEYKTKWPTFSRHLMVETGMLEMVVIELANIKIEDPRHVLELRKALQMIEQLKLRVDTVKLDTVKHVNSRWVRVKASRLDEKLNVSATRDEKLNVSATRVIEMLDAGDVKFDVDGQLCL